VEKFLCNCVPVLLQIIWSVIADEDDNLQTISCKATKKTWANQRRKRRLAAQHQQTIAKRAREEQHEEQDSVSSSIILQEIQVDSCHLEFTCIASRDSATMVQFKYLLGDSKDDLHQIIQYLKNQLTLFCKKEQHTVHNKHQQKTQ